MGITCEVCEIHKRDRSDVSRKLAAIQGSRVSLGAPGQDLELEINALATALAEIDARYMKHRKVFHGVL